MSKRAKSSSAPGADPRAASKFIDFINGSPSPFHAVARVEEHLTAAGFEKLSERDEWGSSLKPGGKYYVTRNQTAVVAFAVGGKWKPGNAFNIVAAHTDSPCLKVKPVSAKKKDEFLQVGVECYGGGLWHTWFDRDLGVAGRVIVEEDDGSFKTHLVRIDKPILRVPTLAIHLNRTVNEKGFLFNKETHLAPVLALEATKALTGGAGSGSGSGAGSGAGAGAGAGAAPTSLEKHHHPKFLGMLASELSVDPKKITGTELYLFDTHESTIGGADDEFIFSARLDNLMMSFTSLQALLASTAEGSDWGEDPTVRAIALFDNEEVGSNSLMGAASTLVEQVMRRAAGTDELAAIALRKSYLVSADMAHASHPNYPSKHEDLHRPKMNAGIVIKTNGSQRYATAGPSTHILKQAAKRCGAPIQEFVVRQDMGCGSTIGPIMSTALGMRTIDVGIAQLSMHSIREMCGSADVGNAIELFTAHYSHFAEIDAALVGAD